MARWGDAKGVLGRDVVVRAGRSISLDRRRLLLSLICSTDVRRGFTATNVLNTSGGGTVLVYCCWSCGCGFREGEAMCRAFSLPAMAASSRFRFFKTWDDEVVVTDTIRVERRYLRLLLWMDGDYRARSGGGVTEWRGEGGEGRVERKADCHTLDGWLVGGQAEQIFQESTRKCRNPGIF